MDMDGDQNLELYPLHLGEFPSCLVNESVEQLQKIGVSLLHDFMIVGAFFRALVVSRVQINWIPSRPN